MAAIDDFRRWYVKTLDPLKDNPEAGFIFVLVALPLLERYLRNKLHIGAGKLGPDFHAALNTRFPDILGKAEDFWDCYRNGLLHQATFKKGNLEKGGIWVNLPDAGLSGHDERPVYFVANPDRFYLNPIAFFDFVTTMITDDFEAYENSTAKYPLPRVEAEATGQATVAPLVSPIDLSSIDKRVPTIGSSLRKPPPSG